MKLGRVGVALALLSLGCDPNREGRIAAQMAELCRAEESVRVLPNAAKADALGRLARAPCPDAQACAARDRCTAGYALHVDALQLTQVAKQNLADGRAEQAAKLLGAAEEKLKLAQAGIDECTALMGQQRRARCGAP